MARFKCVATPENPHGEMIPLTPDEEAEADAREATHAVEVIERRWSLLRAERNRRLAATDGVAIRHQEQIARGVARTLTDDAFARLLEYRQALRDLPTLTSDPASPRWPASPV